MVAVELVEDLSLALLGQQTLVEVAVEDLLEAVVALAG
jgi:hypothetical protein